MECKKKEQNTRNTWNTQKNGNKKRKLGARQTKQKRSKRRKRGTDCCAEVAEHANPAMASGPNGSFGRTNAPFGSRLMATPPNHYEGISIRPTRRIVHPPSSETTLLRSSETYFFLVTKSALIFTHPSVWRRGALYKHPHFWFFFLQVPLPCLALCTK